MLDWNLDIWLEGVDVAEAQRSEIAAEMRRIAALFPDDRPARQRALSTVIACIVEAGDAPDDGA